MENVLVNFRLPENRLELVRKRAARRQLTVSAYIRTCVEVDLANGQSSECEGDSWASSLPASVRDLIGVAEGAVADEQAARKSYREYLAEKYA